MSANLRLSQALADQRAAIDKARLLSPDRPRLIPSWVFPLAVLILAGFAFDLWIWYGFVAFIFGATFVLIEIIEASKAARKGQR